MSQPTRARFVRLAGAIALGASLLLPAAAPAAAADPVVLTVGTTTGSAAAAGAAAGSRSDAPSAIAPARRTNLARVGWEDRKSTRLNSSHRT